MKYLKYFCCIMILKCIYNFVFWLYGYFLHHKWVKYFNSNNKNLMSYYYQIIEYLNNLPYEEISTDIYSVSNQKYIENLFLKSHGFYRYKFLQNFNPFYWIKLIIFLPQKLIDYLGIRFKRRTIKFLNLIYWIFSFVFVLYKDEIISYSKDLIKLIFEYFTKK